MRTRILSLLIAVSVFMSLCASIALADTGGQVFAATLQNTVTNGYIADDVLTLKISGAQSGSEARVYQVGCSYGGETKTYEMSIEPRKTTVEYISVDARQGVGELTATVSYNGGEIYRKSFSVNVISRYKHQFMEQISKKGINGVEKSNIDYFKLMGLQTSRNGYEWGWTEKEIGVYDWPSVHQDTIDAGINPVFLCCYGNTLYNGGKADKTGPTSKYEIDAFAKYVTEAAKKYPQIKYYEVWNEPNISFWLPEPNIYDYINVLEVINQELKRVDDKNVTIGGSMAVSDFAFTEKLFDLNASAAMDAFSVHPYCYPGASDIYVKTQLEEFERKVLKHGGWQIKVSTEFGFPTDTSYRGMNVERQAKEIIKHFAITDDNDYEINQIYRMDDLAINGSHDPGFNEDNFGVIYYDKTPKPAVLAIKTMAEMTNGGLPFGQIETPYGVSEYFYIKDGETTAVIWRNDRTNGATPQTLSFDETVAVYDMNGNLISTGHTAPVTSEPVYVKGISNDTSAKALSSILRRKFNDKLNLLDSYSALRGFEQMKALLYNGLDYCTYSSMPDEATAANNLESYYNNVLGGMVELYKNGTFGGNEEQLASMLYIAHLGGLRLMDLYMLAVNTPDSVMTASEELSKAEERISENSKGGTLVCTGHIFRFAKEMNENLRAVSAAAEENPMRDGMKKGWDKMVSLLSQLAVKMSEVEEVTHNNILVQLPSSEQSFNMNEVKETKVSLYNYKDMPINGRIQILDPVGKVIGTSEEVKVAAGESMAVPVSTLFDREFDEGEMIKVRFAENGSVLKTVEAPFELNILTPSDSEFVTYTASDFDEAATRHEYRWMYSYDDVNYYPMDFADGKTYKTSTIDKNRYIACRVTPVYADGTRAASELQKKGVITSLSAVTVAELSAEKRYETRFTPPEYRFRLEGTQREYSLLDVFEGENDSRYFVLSDFLTANLEQHNIDPQNINPDDKDSIGYWLNNTYVKDGYSLGGRKWQKLEEDIYDYIDKNHKWSVEAGISESSTGAAKQNNRGYSYTAGIGILTETESVKYLGRYGWNVTTENKEWYNPWLLATGNADTDKYVEVMNFKVADGAPVRHSGEHMFVDVTPGGGHGELYARPAFYLNDDFFKSVRLDVDNLGAHVKKIIMQNYTKNELAAIYSESELEKIGYAAKPVGIKRFTIKDGEIRAKVEIPSEGCHVFAAAYNADGSCTGVSLVQNGEISFGCDASMIKAFYWDSFEGMRPIYPTAVQMVE